MSVVAFTILALVGASHNVAAQEVAGAGRVELNLIPVGGIWFTNGDRDVSPSFRNYALGASVAVNVNRVIGLEGEFAPGIGFRQTVTFAGVGFRTKVPNTWAYNGNFVYNPGGSDTRFVPYATAGIGAMVLRPRSDFENISGFTDSETFFTQNFGGGVKWFTASHWGLRGDYRFLIVDGKSNANTFFAGDNENRFANRVYGAFVITY